MQRLDPGRSTSAPPAIGGLAHLVGEVFMQQTGISVQYVQYKGGSQGTVDLLGGTIDAQMMSSAVAAGQVDNTRLKILRSQTSTASVSCRTCRRWRKVAFPALIKPPGKACSPRPVCRNRSVSESPARCSRITSDPAYQQKLRQSGFEPLPLDGAATERMYREELRQWTALIKERGLAGK